MNKDPDYVPYEQPDLPHKKRKPKIGSLAPKATRLQKSSVMQAMWPQIESLAKQGLQPKDIAAIVNLKLTPASKLTNKHISDLITRKKKEGSVELNVMKTAGGLNATNGDCM
jgi:hypothetical protein